MHPVGGRSERLAAAAGGGPYTAGLVTQRPALGCLFEIVETLVLTLIIFVVIQNFVAQPYKVQQQSMERTLEPEQYVLVDKLTPRFDTYKRGDIVVFTPPEDWGVPGRVCCVARATRTRPATPMDPSTRAPSFTSSRRSICLAGLADSRSVPALASGMAGSTSPRHISTCT